MDISSKTISEKVDEILTLLKKHEIKTEVDITSLKKENQSLNLRLAESEGIISRLNSKVEKLEQKVESLQTHTMKMNILFHNLPEQQNENCTREIYNFIKTHLQIEEEDIYSRQNPTGEIRVDIAHRIGKKSNKPRAIVTRFVTQCGRDMVLKKGHLLKGSPFGLSEQLPSDTRQRRTAQIPTLTALRREAREKNSQDNIKLIKDKMIINNKVQSEVFEKNPLNVTMSVGETINYNMMLHSSVTMVNGSTFQGHYYPIHSGEEAHQALRAIFQNRMLAQSHHAVYGYNYLDINGDKVSGFSDDGEWQAGVILKDLLDKSDNPNGILIVT